MKIAVVWSILATIVVSQEIPSLPDANPPYYRVRYSAGSAPGELVYGVSYTVWIPPGVKTLRGVIVHQHGCGEGACKGGQTAAYDLQWQALAKKHDCCLMGPSYEQPDKADCQMWCDPRNGSDKSFLRSLDDLAKVTGHPELSSVPWALWGHSGGGTWAGTMLMLHPDRIAAVWLRSGAPKLTPREDSKLPTLSVPQGALQIPVMCNLGTQEGVTVKDGRFSGVWPNMEAFFKKIREQDGLIAVAIDPLSSHECGNQRYLAIPWFDACLKARLPSASGTPLRPMPRDQERLAPLLSTEFFDKVKFTGNSQEASWFLNEEIALRWSQYSRDTLVEDSTAPPPVRNAKVRGNELTWELESDLESGLASIVIERDGVELVRLPEKNATSPGRPTLQRNSYHDTPSQPMAEWKYIDANAAKDRTYLYRITTINTVGRRSPTVDFIAP